MKYDNENLKIIEENILDLISLGYVKNYLRIDNDCDDEFIKNTIYFAYDYAEKTTGKTFGFKKYELTFSTEKSVLKIDKMPIFINEVLSFYANDLELSRDEYQLKNGILFLNKAISGDIKITFLAGSNMPLPADIKQAILFHIANIYQNKNGDCQVPQATQEIYDLYRKIKI